MQSSKNTCLIFGNGTYESPIFYKSYLEDHKNDFVIAVDGGFNFLRTIGVQPDLLIGDMDSIQFSLPNIETIKVNREKDETDTRLALDYCLENDYRNVIMFGMLSIERTDHSLANLFLLEKYSKMGMNLHLENNFNDLFCLIGPNSEIIKNKKDWTISILPLTDQVDGFKISGVKYPLEKVRLSRINSDFTVSNEIENNKCELSLEKGVILIDLIQYKL